MECLRCPYNRYPRIPATPIPPNSPNSPTIELAIVGEAPGVSEISQKRPFVGASGQLLQRALEACKLPSGNTVFVTNALLCRPPQGVPIKREAVDLCRARLLAELRAVQPKLVLALGNTAMHALTGNYKLKITAEQGRLLNSPLLPGLQIVPAFHPAKILRVPEDYKVFRGALLYATRLIRGGEPLTPGTTEYITVASEAQIPAAIALLSSRASGMVAADIETTGLNSRRGEILCVGIAYEKNRVLVITRDLIHKNPDSLKDLFRIPNLRWIWHNGKFDTAFLRRRGIPAVVDHDTLLLHYCLNEAKGTHDLEQLSGTLLGAEAYKAEANVHMRSKEGLAGAPEDVGWKRVATDADYTLQLVHKLLPLVEEDPDLHKLYYKLLLPASAFLRRVEKNGLYIDLETLLRLEVSFNEQFNALESLIVGLVGGLWDPQLYREQTGAKTAPLRFKPTSTKQLAWILYDRLKLRPSRRRGSKGRSTDQEVLEEFKHTNKIVAAILNLRAVQKDLSTYVRGIKKRLDDGRVHTTFLLHGTGTGRLSSRQPNLQNITKKRPDIREMFQAPPGKVLLEVDYKGVELRVLAHLSGDHFLTRCFMENRDLHAEVAISFFGHNYTYEDRMKAKTLNFGIPYGRTEYSLAEAFHISKEEALELIQKWFERAPEAAAYLAAEAEAITRGEVLTTPFGRKKRVGLVTAEALDSLMNEARNYRIQSVASDLTLKSGITMEAALTKLGVKILNLVHDSILFELRDDPLLIEEAKAIIKEVMERVPREALGTSIPFEVEFAQGYNWNFKD